MSDRTDKLLTVAEAARFLEVSEQAVRKLIGDSRLPYSCKGVGNKYRSGIRIRESALIKFMKEDERKS